MRKTCAKRILYAKWLPKKGADTKYCEWRCSSKKGESDLTTAELFQAKRDQ
jgi:hypothetical protein